MYRAYKPGKVTMTPFILDDRLSNTSFFTTLIETRSAGAMLLVTADSPGTRANIGSPCQLNGWEMMACAPSKVIIQLMQLVRQ